MTQAFRASWILAFDGRQHVIVENGIVAWDGDTIAYVGKDAPQFGESLVELPGRLIMPGMICLHSHAGSQGVGRLPFHLGRRDVFGGGFQNTLPRRGAQRPADEDPAPGALATLAELAMGGATTVLDAGSPTATCNALLAARETVPVRLLLGPGFRSADFAIEDDGRISYDWRPDGGIGLLNAARDWLERLPGGGAGDSMVRGVVYPSILDYCTAELLVESKMVADERGWLLQIHACQSLFEFHEILHRTTKTPIEWLDSLGILGPRTSLAHCFATTAHPDTAYRGGRDLELLAASGTTVAHCPVAISRRGNHLHTLDGYQRAGVNVAIGCDTFPRDMLNEMRTASTVAKVASGDVEFGSARAVVNAATLAAAKAIGRDDLGRIATGAAADFIAIDLRRLAVGPVRDPVDAALSSAYSRDIETVVIAGKTVVAGSKIAGVDEYSLLEKLQKESEAAWASVPGFHWTGKSADEIFPRSFPVVEM